jgi:hypothetical protein
LGDGIVVEENEIFSGSNRCSVIATGAKPLIRRMPDDLQSGSKRFKNACSAIAGGIVDNDSLEATLAEALQTALSQSRLIEDRYDDTGFNHGYLPNRK